MFEVFVKVFVAGSKMAEFFSPSKGSYWMVPPLMKARPSGKSSMALQNMSQLTLNWVKVPATGSNRSAPDLFEGP